MKYIFFLTPCITWKSVCLQILSEFMHYILWFFLYAAKKFYLQKLLVHLFILENHFLPMFGQKGPKSSFLKEILFFTNGDQECSWLIKLEDFLNSNISKKFKKLGYWKISRKRNHLFSLFSLVSVLSVRYDCQPIRL